MRFKIKMSDISKFTKVLNRNMFYPLALALSNAMTKLIVMMTPMNILAGITAGTNSGVLLVGFVFQGKI